MRRRSFLKWVAAVPLAVKAGSVLAEKSVVRPMTATRLVRSQAYQEWERYSGSVSVDALPNNYEKLMTEAADKYYKNGMMHEAVFGTRNLSLR